MNYTYTYSPTQLTAQACCDASGIECTGMPGWAIEERSITFDLPGVDSLDVWQQAALDILAEYRLTGRERFPGAVGLLVTHGGLQVAKREKMKTLLAGNPVDDPIGGLMRIMAVATNAGLNGLRLVDVPIEDAVATASGMVDMGIGD